MYVHEFIFDDLNLAIGEMTWLPILDKIFSMSNIHFLTNDLFRVYDKIYNEMKGNLTPEDRKYYEEFEQMISECIKQLCDASRATEASEGSKKLKEFLNMYYVLEAHIDGSLCEKFGIAKLRNNSAVRSLAAALECDDLQRKEQRELTRDECMEIVHSYSVHDCCSRVDPQNTEIDDKKPQPM